MSIQVLFFGATADIARRRCREIDLPFGMTAKGIIDQLLAEYPHFGDHKLHFSVNQEFATGNEILDDGDELAVFTAVSGG